MWALVVVPDCLKRVAGVSERVVQVVQLVQSVTEGRVDGFRVLCAGTFADMSPESAVESTGIDAVLEAQPPRFTPDEACGIAAQAFGIVASSARNLGSERDQTFMLLSQDGAGLAVMKVSNPAEDTATLDMEALVGAARCAADPGLIIAQPRLVSGGRTAVDSATVAALPGPLGGDALGTRSTTCFPAEPGSTRRTLADPALIAWGETAARLGLALRSFIHPKAIRRLPWDVQYAASVRPMLAAVTRPIAAGRYGGRPATATTSRRTAMVGAARPGDPQRPDHRQCAG